MKTDEVAKILGVTPMTIRNWADKGTIKCTRVGSHRHFDLCDVRDVYLSAMRNKLLITTMYWQRIKKVKSLSEEDRKKLYKDGLFCDYMQLIKRESVNNVISLAGTKEGVFRKLVKLSNISEPQKEECNKLIEEVAASRLRHFRNSCEHDLFASEILTMEEVESVFNKIFHFFEIIDPEFYVREIASGEDAITMHLHHINSSIKLEEIELCLLQGLGKGKDNDISIDFHTAEISIKRDGKVVGKWFGS